MSTYIHLLHKVDIHNKTTVTNQAGQKKPTWTLATSGVKCLYVPRYSRFTQIVVAPTTEETEMIQFFFDGKTEVLYKDRLYNVIDRGGNVLEAGPLEVIEVIKNTGFSGKIRFKYIAAKRITQS